MHAAAAPGRRIAACEGCFWKGAFSAVQNLLRKAPIIGSLLQVAAGYVCGPCAILVSAAVTGIQTGSLKEALKAGVISAATAAAFWGVGNLTGHGDLPFGDAKHLANVAGHAAVGCASAMASGGKCGAGALSAAAGSFAGPLMSGLKGVSALVAHAVVGGLASVAGGGKFENGAVTTAFGYLFNQMAGQALGGVAGGYFGSALGAGLAGLYAAITGRTCAPAAPYIVGASAAAGRWGGGIVGSAFEDWIYHSSSNEDNTSTGPGPIGERPKGVPDDWNEMPDKKG